MARKSTVRGDRETARAMRMLAGEIRAADVKAVMRDSLEPMRQDAREAARKLRQKSTPNGKHLDQGIVTRNQRSRRKLLYEVWMGAVRRARKIAHLVEFGTAPHWQPKRGVMHPGARPKPFMSPAFEEHKQSTFREFSKRIWPLVRGATMRAAKKAGSLKR